MADMNKFQGVQTTVINNFQALSIDGIYRGTTVCRRFTDGRVELNSGGWRTSTTKTRMNQFSNEFCNGRFKVYQKGNEWFVDVENKTVTYVDGMII